MPQRIRRRGLVQDAAGVDFLGDGGSGDQNVGKTWRNDVKCQKKMGVEELSISASGVMDKVNRLVVPGAIGGKQKSNSNS